MCGICGYVGFRDPEMLERMTGTLKLRGPDDAGTALFPEEKVGLGHRRLAIIDLSPAGHQPMFGRNGLCCIVYNGEVYNFLELRKELISRGWNGASRSDTEVILGCYEHWGLGMMARLDGIFAFALYDAERKKVFLARDHLGVKPLYYTLSSGRLLFGSEIKALLVTGLISPDLNEQALWDYLTFTYVPCPGTMYRGILQLPPGHVGEFDLASGRFTLTRYWNPLLNLGPMLTDAGEMRLQVRSLLSQTVRAQMVSDVPLGAFLSGGIDSTVVVGLMAEHSSGPVNTFTAVFPDAEVGYVDETLAARRVAERFATNHEEVQIPLPTLDDLTTILSWTDQPFGNPTLILSFLISRAIRRNVTVALSGAGGDELFGGYVRYRYFPIARKLIRHFPSGLGAFAGAVNRFWPGSLKPELRGRAFKFFRGLTNDIGEHYLLWTYFLDEDQKARLLPAEGDRQPSRRVLQKLFEEAEVLGDPINALEYVDLLSYLRDDILEYTDKSSMATSLEVRVPFLSPRMVELSLRIPGRNKIQWGKSKIVLREAFRDLIPAENLHRPKMGFSAPARVWMNNLDPLFDELLTDLPRDCPLNVETIQRLRMEHRTGFQHHSQTLFSLLMLLAWMVPALYRGKVP